MSQETVESKRGIATPLLFFAVFAAFAALYTVHYAFQNRALLFEEPWLRTGANSPAQTQASDFFTEGQGLSENMLDLGAWGGYNEVLRKKPATLTDLSCKFRIQEKGYLCVVFDHQADRSWCLRLSSLNEFPNALIQYDSAGRFIASDFIQVPPVSPGEWHTLQLAVHEAAIDIVLDEQKFNVPAQIEKRAGTFGFRNGFARATVTDVHFTDALSGATRAESFEMHRQWGRVLGRPLLRAAILLVVLLVAGRKLLGNWNSVFRYGLVLVLLLFVAGIPFGLFRFSAPAPPISKPAAVEQASPDAIQRCANDVKAKCSGDGKHVLFLGGSRTLDIGANAPTKCYAAAVEPVLKQECKGCPPIRCINGGVPAGATKDIAALYKAIEPDCRADVTVLGVGSADSLPGQTGNTYGADLEALARGILDHGSKLILLIEPACIEEYPDGWSVNEETRRVGTQLNVPVIDVHDYFRAQVSTGFLFTDSAHLSTFGHWRIAECLVEPILKALNP